jgi:predicted dehydrogenase
VEPIRVGIVGCGEVSQIIHLPSLAMLPEQFRVTALCDVSRKVVDGVAERWGVSMEHRFLDYRELVIRHDVDAVLIANPNAYHAEVILAAASAGKHVLVEKPMCVTLREADAIIAAQQRNDVTIQVGLMRRYAPAFLQACQMVRAMGEIRVARVHDIIGQNGLIINQTSRVMRGDDIAPEILEAGRALNGRLVREAVGEAPQELYNAYQMLLGLSTHDISAMRELLGMPKRVLHAACRNNGWSMTAAFDYGSYVCQFETGSDRIPRYDTYLEVFGTEQVLKVVYDTPYVRNMPIRLLVTEANATGGLEERSVHPAWGDAFVLEWQAFHESIAQGKAPKTSAADSRLDLELFASMISLMR